MLLLLLLLLAACCLQEKAAIKAQKDASEAKYKHALVDGRQEQVRAADRRLAGSTHSSKTCVDMLAVACKAEQEEANCLIDCFS
jgi:hypothetical protein